MSADPVVRTDRRVAVIGLGYVGLPLSIAFLEAHDVEYVYFKQGLPNRNTGGGLGMPGGGGAGMIWGTRQL